MQELLFCDFVVAVFAAVSCQVGGSTDVVFDVVVLIARFCSCDQPMTCCSTPSFYKTKDGDQS